MRESYMTRWLSYAVLAVLAAAPTPPPALDSIIPNDNRQATGTLDKGVLTVALEARTGSWYPEGDKGRAVDVAEVLASGE